MTSEAPSMGNNGKPRWRGRKPRRLGLLFLVVGFAVFLIGSELSDSESGDKVRAFQRVGVAAHTGSVTFPHTGNYVAYYESKALDTSNGVPLVPVTLTSPSGETKRLTTTYGNRSDKAIEILGYDESGHNGTAVWQFTINEAGRYRVDLGRDPISAPDATMAFGKSIETGTFIALLVLLLGSAIFIAGIVLVIVGVVKTRRHKKRFRRQPPAEAYPPPPRYYGVDVPRGPSPSSG